MSQHKQSKSKTYLSRSIKKHGWDKFKNEIIIDDVPEEDLSNLEISYIEVENTMVPHGYNLTLGGEGSTGFKHTEKGREKIKQANIRRHANRDQFGCVRFHKPSNKYEVRGPGPDQTFIGLYFTKAKAEESLNYFNATGERIESDRIRRKKGTGSIHKRENAKRYEAMYTKNKKQISKTFDTPEECEEWLKTELNFKNL